LFSSQTLLPFGVGVTLYASFFHWAFRRHLRGGLWLTGWSALATLYVIARYVQMTSDDPRVVVWASRAFTAVAPALIWTMLSFLLELTERPPGPLTRRAMLVGALGLGALTLATPWFVTGELVIRHDLFGKPFLASRGGPAFGVTVVLLAAGLAWALRALVLTRALEPQERRVLGACIVAYGALAGSSVLSSLGLSPIQGVAEYGPLLVSIGTSHLIASRERKLASGLSSLVDRQTAALRASEERYRGLVESAPIGVLSCDQDGTVLAVTERFRKILGLGAPPQRPVPVNLYRDAPAHIHEQIQFVKRALESGEIAQGEMPYRTANDGLVRLKIVIAPRRSPAGAPDGALILIEDVTERRAVESRLRQSLKLEAIGQLAAGIAEGITTPMRDVRERLAAMRAGSDELRKELGGGSDAESLAWRFAELEQLIDESCEGVERSLEIVRDMREISQGKSLAAESVDVNELLDGVVRMAATQRRSGVELVERYGILPRITANAGQLRQMFLNLTMNAIQAVGERGRVEIETAPERDGVRIRVRDDGPGISRADRERLFVPFFTTKAAGEGTGLGLFLSYQIAQSHHGEIRVMSEPGAGATFEIWLPCQHALAAEGAAA
jgi:PAS domain S-box-containing protein